MTGQYRPTSSISQSILDLFLQDNRRNVQVLRRNQLHIDGRDDRDVGRDVEHRLHCLEGRAAQGRRRQAGEAGLCQGLVSSYPVNNMQSVLKGFASLMYHYYLRW